MYRIYQIINKINGKSYVGFTIHKLSKRWSEHKCAAKIGGTFLIHRAIRKYGDESFLLKTIEEGLDHKQGLESREPYWISALKPEYNMTIGGEGTLGHKGQIPWSKGRTRPECSEALRAYYKTPSGQALREKKKALVGSKNPNFGKTLSVEQRTKKAEQVRLWWSNPKNKERMRQVHRKVGA